MLLPCFLLDPEDRQLQQHPAKNNVVLGTASDIRGMDAEG